MNLLNLFGSLVIIIKKENKKKKKYIELILTEFLSHHSLKLNEDDKEKIENITIKLEEIERTLTI